mgnify:CR=1 FL=1
MNSVMSVIKTASEHDGISINEYIRNNVSIYGAYLFDGYNYKELIAELNSMLSSEIEYGIMELLRKEDLF